MEIAPIQSPVDIPAIETAFRNEADDIVEACRRTIVHELESGKLEAIIGDPRDMCCGCVNDNNTVRVHAVYDVDPEFQEKAKALHAKRDALFESYTRYSQALTAWTADAIRKLAASDEVIYLPPVFDPDA